MEVGQRDGPHRPRTGMQNICSGGLIVTVTRCAVESDLSVRTMESDVVTRNEGGPLCDRWTRRGGPGGLSGRAVQRHGYRHYSEEDHRELKHSLGGSCRRSQSERSISGRQKSMSSLSHTLMGPA